MGKIFKTLRILDESGQISLTNLSLLASIAKIMFFPQGTLTDWALVLTTLASYQFKRWHSAKQTDTSLYDDRFKSLENQISTIKSAMSLRK